MGAVGRTMVGLFSKDGAFHPWYGVREGRIVRLGRRMSREAQIGGACELSSPGGNA